MNFSLFQLMLFKLLKVQFKVWRRISRDCNPRYWSNDELKKLGPRFNGSVLNVSGENDEDKEGGHYRDYFINSRSYSISNYHGVTSKEDFIEYIQLDLSQSIPADSDLLDRFDLVFSHTVLEHIFDVETAVTNLSKISKNYILSIVPFIQSFHHNEKYYDDFWRISPYSMVRLFEKHGLKTVYINWNNDPLGNIYVLHLASKHPEPWEGASATVGPHPKHGPGYFRQLLLAGGDMKRERPSGIIGGRLYPNRPPEADKAGE